MLRVKLTPNAIGEVGAGSENDMILDADPDAAAPENADHEMAAVGEQEAVAPEIAALGLVPMLQEIEMQPEIEEVRKGKRKKKDNSSADVVNWASCESCGKWRVVNRSYHSSEKFYCVHLESYDPDNAKCDVPSVWIEDQVQDHVLEDVVPAIKKKKAKK